MNNFRVWNTAKKEEPEIYDTPTKSYLEWTITRLGSQEKALWKEAMMTITSQNCTLIQPLGKWTRTGHIQQIALLAPETGLL